jgi:ABC-2 type transport system permease protein
VAEVSTAAGYAVRVAPASAARARHFLYVMAALARTEFKLRYAGSVLGYLWTLLRPLMLFGVLYTVFTQIFRFGGGIPHYPVMLLMGIILFSFFADATNGALQSLVQRENLLRKVAFPRAAIPVSVSLTAAANLLLGLVVVFALAIVDGVEVRTEWLAFVPILAVVLGLATAVSLLLAVLYVRYRDVGPIWEVILQLLFWGTPIIYTIQTVPERLREVVMLNPLAVAVQQARHSVIDIHEPSAAAAIGRPILLLVPALITLGVAGISLLTFSRLAPTVAEDL